VSRSLFRWLTSNQHATFEPLNPLTTALIVRLSALGHPNRGATSMTTNLASWAPRMLSVLRIMTGSADAQLARSERAVWS
jgi:hypothetical protein